MRHDLEGVLRTFGATARYDDEPWHEHYDGIDGVRRFYSRLIAALPDLNIEILRQHFADEAVILEVIIRGTHLGAWKGLPATGRRLAIPLCGFYTFTADDRLAGERIYYDRATVLQQLGVLHDPQEHLRSHHNGTPASLDSPARAGEQTAQSRVASYQVMTLLVSQEKDLCQGTTLDVP